ncbi:MULTISPECIES: alanine racemase [Staphylococcus]|uniref:Alanine racemase n=1 Tax=Staphylococcus agnetis TaxID=985762 RepID=A0A2T4MIV8_9STAP|nr:MULTISPECIES: alanine racemase [Staphylococcus]NHM93364.1 alanine racemase [Staphylococcus sp. 10602379]NJI03301.1 alanine racemase [Staphylococcus agnetis]NJI13965.1 alanine racemase [Staphylococcus agnetis]PTH15338.1 alanine racemase [Staphylococcus agnetis]PTH29351.1 alanine racemase [Staphylococcus agnetis]
MTALWQLNTQLFRENIRRVKQHYPIMAVVKNNAYNYGLAFAIKTFMEEGIDTFSTTSLSEAIQIRQLAPRATIFLMNPSREFDVLRENDIHVTLPSKSFYVTHKHDLVDIHVHIEYENLLHRSGFQNIDDIRDVLEDHAQNQSDKMIVTGLWTHFGYADEFDVEDYHIEKHKWRALVDELHQDGYQFELIHAQNSASYFRENGIFSRHSHVRVGIALYGSRPFASVPRHTIKQALTLKANVIQVRTVHEGEHCGYSFAYTAQNDHTKLAVVDIGYGDGILRTRAQHDVLINDKRYPIRALMMSHMFVEVDANVKAGDEVIIYNDILRIDDYTFKGVGANSEQLSALNLNSLIKEYQS